MNISDRLNIGLRRKVPLVLQTEASECGLASLAMIAQFHGYNADLAELRRRFGMSLKGATLKDVIKVGDQIGLAARPLRLEVHELGNLRLPCILHWDMNHFVVLARVDSKGAEILDPSVGPMRMTFPELCRHFTGVALELTPTTKFETTPPRPPLRLSQILGHMGGLRRALGSLLLVALAVEIFAMTSPLFLGWVVDHVLVSSDSDLLHTLTIGFFLLLLIQVAITGMRGWMLMALNASLKLQARANLLTHLLNLPTSYFEARHLGDVMSRFGSQDTILQAITSEFLEAILDGLMAVVTLTIMFLLAPTLTIVVLLGAAVYAALRWALYAPLRQASAEMIVWGARKDSHFLETLRGIRTVKLFGAQDERRVHWLNFLVQTLNCHLTIEKLRLLFRSAKSFLLGALMILIVWLGARQIMNGGFSVGLLFAFISYKVLFLQRVSELINKAVDLRMLHIHAERLSDIALTAPEPRGVLTRPSATEILPASIELRNVSFRYSEHEPWILKDISVRFSAGESVAIVGPSGGGKSTLFKLLCGLLQPTRGEILVNGEPLTSAGLENYRSILGVVMQDDQLFAGSLAENISFFADSPDTRRVEACAMQAAIHDDIQRMPMGYQTLIGDMGTILSGGQKQRVLIARALYRKPAILLLDEATSHLDLERERAVNDALRSTRMTRIVIAHRPETIRASERIISLVDGEIEKGAPRILHAT